MLGNSKLSFFVFQGEVKAVLINPDNLFKQDLLGNTGLFYHICVNVKCLA